MKRLNLILGLILFSFFTANAQNNAPKADRFANITIAVVNSERAFHVATIRYFDENNDILLNTSEEFKIDISRAERFKTGSIRKTIPIYPNTKRIQVEVNHCSSLHENDFYIEDLEKAGNDITFVFKREFEKVIIVKFEGIQDKKPCSFKIKGVNTNVIYYGDYANASKVLYEESRREDIKIEMAESSLYPYRIVNIDPNVPFKIEDRERVVKVQVEYIDPSGGGSSATTPVAQEEPEPKRENFGSKKEYKEALKAWKEKQASKAAGTN